MTFSSRRKRLSLLVAALSAGVAAQAVAADHPRLTPERDVTVVYQLTAPSSHLAPGHNDVKVYFSGSGDQLRIDSADGNGITILDRPGQLVTLVMVPRKIYTRLRPEHGLHSPFMLDLEMQYKKVGQERVAGVACQRWDIQTSHGKAAACVTDDGVILAENGVDADGVEGSLRAVSVNYDDLASDTFQPPSDFEELKPRNASSHVTGNEKKPTESATPSPVPEASTPAGGEDTGSGAQAAMPVQPDTTEPSVPNDSAGDGSVTTPDQPPSGPSNGNRRP
ncbi:hypothetical protein [Gluconobacter morbifer]|uniref:DUF4412 domain-containing protein n=1 Tax=Gluconobacter morbifer G707 TaxID=1088869 RepID=G6XFT6_9PROT|nr:hypothetical protein [Gluconobacter morbifer]EHH69044.1 hypothetical protein GMO_03510 [Gluconobacter morbifer G707]